MNDTEKTETTKQAKIDKITKGLTAILTDPSLVDNVITYLYRNHVVIEIEPWLELPLEREKSIGCPSCRGYGKIDHYKRTEYYRPTHAEMYDDGRHGGCFGREYTHTTICERCKGKKRIPINEILKDEKCPWCTDGKKYNHSSENQFLVPCSQCEGTGQLKPLLIRGSLRDVIEYAMVISLK